MSFRLKTILGVALIEALLLSLLVVGSIHYLTTSNERQLVQRAQTTAKLVATMTGDAVIAVDLATLDSLVEQALRNKDIVFLRIRSESGIVLSEGGNAEALAAPFKIEDSLGLDDADQQLTVSAPITIGNTSFGQVELALSTEIFHTTISTAFRWLAGIALSEMILVALAGLALGTYLTRQLHSLMAGAKQVATGDFGHQIDVKGRDELADTAISFNQMSEALRQYADIAEEARMKAETGRELAESTLQDAVNSMRDGVVICNEDGTIVLANQAYRSIYGLSEDDLSHVSEMVQRQSTLVEESAKEFVSERMRRLAASSLHDRWETSLKDGRKLLIAQHPMVRGGTVTVETDVTELYDAYEENRKLQFELMQRHKTEALGTLAKGMAHEINTPVQFISDNIAFLAGGISDICTMLDKLQPAEGESTIDADTYRAALDDIDWSFLKEEIPHALAEMKNGTMRVGDLTTTFKQFAAPNSHPNDVTDLSQAVRTTVEVGRSEWQVHAEIAIDTEDDLPPVHCHKAQINQVLHNLISNAVDAVQDCDDGRTGRIHIQLGSDASNAWIKITDNGCGIDEDKKHQIFDALYTTKDPGRGTGHGLALCRAIVVDNHNGTLEVSSQPGIGTRFELKLPLNRDQQAA